MARVEIQVDQNTTAIQTLIDQAKQLNELPVLSVGVGIQDADLFLLRIASTGQTVSCTAEQVTALFSSGVNQIIAGANITVTPSGGTGNVTITAASGGATSFLGLTDTPANYNAKNGQNVKVDAGGNGLLFSPDYKDFDLTPEGTSVQTGTSYSLICNRVFKFVDEFVFSVNTAPTGSSIIIDVRQNGTTILTQLANIEAGEKSTSTSATPGAVNIPISFNIGDSLAFRVTQVGSSLPGAGLRCTMTYNVPYVV